MKSKLSSSACPAARSGRYQPLGGAGRRCRCTAVEYPVTGKHSVVGDARRKLLRSTVLMQGQADGVGPVLAQDAFLPQRAARAQDALLQPGRCAIRGSAGLAVSERHSVNALAAGASNPVGRRATAHSKLRRYRAQASPRAHRLNELAAALFDRTFLAIDFTFRNLRTLQQARSRYGTRGPILRPAAPRTSRRAGEIPVALRAPSISPAQHISRIQCPTNAETQVSN